MIKKLRNQPYAPKMGSSPQVGARGSKKKKIMNRASEIMVSNSGIFHAVAMTYSTPETGLMTCVFESYV
jgi:hypothetical protein